MAKQDLENLKTTAQRIKSYVDSVAGAKQDLLTAGEGIQIVNNIISVSSSPTPTPTTEKYSKFIFGNDSGVLTAVSGDCATAFDSSTNTIDMEALIEIYPFSEIAKEDIQLQYSGGTNLSGVDKFVTAPNLYYCHSVGSDNQTEVIEFANYKVNDSFKRPYEDDNVSKVAIACYLASEDTSGSSKMLRSRSGYAFKANITQAVCETELPYYNGEKVDMLDSRVWFFFKDLMQCFIGYRNGQLKYAGVTDVSSISSYKSGDTDTIVSSTTTMTGEVSSYSSGARPFAILGIENPYGVLWQNLGGLYHTDQNLYQYTGTTHKSNSTFYTSDCDLIATNLCSSSGWQKTLACANNVCYPISVGGSDSKVVGDYYYYNSGERIFFVGGYWNFGSRAGFSALHGLDGFGGSHTSLGFRLSLKM